MNLIAVSFILVAGVNKNIILRIAKPIIKLIAKIRFGERRIIKNLDAAIKHAEDSVSNYSNQFNEMRKQRRNLVKMYIARNDSTFSIFLNNIYDI